MDKEKNIRNAITLLDAILNNWKKKNNNSKEYCIFFPKFSTEENKLTALFPIFEKYDDSTLELAAWGEYDLETYTLSQYIAEEKEIIINDKEIANYKDKKFEDALEAFVKVFYIAQSFKKLEAGSAEYKQNIKNLINEIYDYEDIFVNEVTDELSDVYGIEYEEEDVEETNDGDEFASLLTDEEELVEDEEELDEVEEADETDEIEDVEEVDDGDEFASLLTDEEELVEDEEELDEVEETDETDDGDEFASLLTDEEELVEDEEELDEVEEKDDGDEFANLLTDEEELVEDEEELDEVEEKDDGDEFANLLTDDDELDEFVVEDVENIDEIEDVNAFADLLADDVEEEIEEVTEDEEELVDEEEEVDEIEDIDKIDVEEKIEDVTEDEEELVEDEEEIDELEDIDKIDIEEEIEEVTEDEEELVEDEEELEEQDELDDIDEIDVEEEIEEVAEDEEEIVEDEEEVDELDELEDIDEIDVEEEIEEVTEDEEELVEDEEELEEQDELDDIDEIDVEEKIEEVKENKNQDIETLKKELLKREKQILKEKVENQEEKIEGFDPFEFPEGSENKKYEFNWENKQGLNYVTDKSLKIAYELIRKGEMTLGIKDDGRFQRVIINTSITNLCTERYSTDELIDALNKKEPQIRDRKIFNANRNDFTMRVDSSTDKVCYNCGFDRCPKLIAGYVLYLRNNEQLEKVLKERENFRKENKEISKIYNFTWEVEDGLKYVPQDMYEFAEELNNKGRIHVQNNLDSTGLIEIYSPITCSEYKLLDKEKESLNYNRNFASWVYIRRPTKYKINLCNDYTCRLNACPIVIAGYIHYLRKIGREDLIIKDRLYYLENKEEIDKKNQEGRSKKIEELENKKNDFLENLKNEYENKINNFNDFTDIILNENQTNLHCTIEGKNNIGKNKFVTEVANLLFKVGKTNNANFKKISLQNLAASNTYSYTNKANDKVFDMNGVLYQVESAIKYTELEERKLYVITGITEFVEDYKKYKDNNSWGFIEVRKRQCEHTFELLTKMNTRNYIILDGTEQEIESLLEIEPRLQFIYKNYRFKLPDPSMDEIYKLYIQSLKPELLEIARKDYEKYKKQFIEYIMLNKNFIPLSDTELANYLATYSNSKKQIVFPENVYKKETIEESLKNIIGMESVKTRVSEFEKYMIFQMKAKSAGVSLNATNMHMIFTGNPGTGKTTIARIMAKMLFDLGIIKENKLIEVERKDLIAEYIGQTAIKTAEVINQAMGGVLFIDEAYELAGKGERDFGTEAIATLIKAMEDHKDEFVVIFAGYRNEMQTFIDSNPGIASRIGYTFDFPDYSPDELIQIFNKKMTNMGFEIDKAVEVKLNTICKYFSKRKAFGNGRFVDKLIQEVIMKHSKSDTDDIKLITKEDIPEIEDLSNTRNEEDNKDAKELLKNIVGMESLKEKVLEFEEYVAFLKEAENHKLNLPNQNMHMVFTGNPGTGKTTIARIMAKMLRDLGIIHENKLIEVERKDLVAEYVGQTTIKTSQVIERAMGGVLFIDEAYTLNAHYEKDFGHEAIGTLIKAMEDHKGEFVVIFAGYKDEMKDFIDMNPGIASRIGYTFDFPDYTDTELAEILYRKIGHSGMTISNDSKELVEKVMKYFCNVENIGNGRFVDKVLQEILMKHAKNKKRKIGKIQKEDIPSIKEMTEVVFTGSGMIDVDKITEEDLKKTAVHEVGHACVRLLLFKEPGIKKITINAEGTGTLGYVRHSGTGSYTSSKTELLNTIKVSLAGMVAEQVYFGEFENGNTSDLEKASYIAKNMITKYGMSDLGFGQISNPDGVLAQSIQNEINKMLKQCFDETFEIIKTNKKKIDKVVDYLLKNKEIDEDDLVKNFK